MKKIFFVLFVLASLSIFYHKDKIDFNIYNLLHIQEAQAIKKLQAGLANEIIFVSEQKNLYPKLVELNQKFPIFLSFQSGFDEHFATNLKTLRLATFGEYKQLKTNPLEFFTQSARMLFDPFASRLLPIDEDFFALASRSKLLQQDSPIQLDLADNSFYAQAGEKQFAIVIGTLKQNYKNAELLAFERAIRQENILISGTAIFSAHGQAKGNQEGIWMSIIALVLNLAFLLFAFKNFRIFYLACVVLFALVFGLGASFLFLKQVHILALVISTSLIGMILDFALHFICHCEGQRIQRSLMLPMKKIFLLGFCISAGGYAIFLLSPLEFLHQIALISIFSLLGALLFTYFCLPSILDGTIFHSSVAFDKFLFGLENLIAFLKPSGPLIYTSILMVAIIGCWQLWKNYSGENIKSYASVPKVLFEDTLKIQKLTGLTPPTQILVLKECSFECERTLLSKLKRQHFIEGSKGLAQYFLSQEEQREVLNLLKKASQNKDIVKLYAQLGISDIQNYLPQLKNLTPQSLDEILQNPLSKPYASLYISPDKRLVILEGKTSLFSNQSFNTLLSQIMRQYHANIQFIDLAQASNQGFEIIKHNAIGLKFLGLLFAFILLFCFFGFKASIKALLVIILAILFVLGIFGIFSLELNIFVIFGLILASVIGIDYILFAKNTQISRHLRLKSILCAALTSFISFFVLFFSSTPAVSLFGLSVALGLMSIALLVI